MSPLLPLSAFPADSTSLSSEEADTSTVTFSAFLLALMILSRHCGVTADTGVTAVMGDAKADKFGTDKCEPVLRAAGDRERRSASDKSRGA